ncbi:RNA polymerase sigma factor, sigma-70 family [Prosthecobacter debontii]|uniref:RNA polymerase sigma factor, sigma-70 family n=1 Tax=Prosthecobacter debontii TaxID=48467 RepID=A0A1T4YCQ6_9BACT|nr:sigma-70 family RNA polymerase sigma factor [Prosthecobacter debontii]SKA99308.1 RNA polymerase sigma factor, sigma-70 family [Prosthecobacter debontii]
MNAMPNPPMDEELAALRAGRTAAACEKIVALYGPLVKSACLRVLRDEGLAEDAAQETFVLLVKKASSLPAGTSLAGWLYHAACRTALNHQRTAIRRRVRENSVEALNQMTPDAQPNLWTEIEPHLDDAMLTLPERQRDLVLQCYFQNQSQRSAAAALGCSESVVSRELSAAVEALRQFFTQRRIAVSSVALAGLLATHGASASMVGGSAMVTAMMTAPVSSSLVLTLVQSKFLLTTVAVVSTVTVAAISYGLTHSSATAPGSHGGSASATLAQSGSSRTPSAGAAKKGKWEASFRFTSAMALDQQKKQVLLESDPDARYALLQQMGVRLSRAGFDQLIAKDLDASVASWRDTYTVLSNRAEAFDNYLMAWSNEAPLDALAWVAAQPDGGLGLRKQLLYVLANKQVPSETLREWIGTLTTPTMRQEAMIALESIGNPASLIARMGTGGNEGFLVDLALLHRGKDLDWAAFGRKLAAGKSAIVARAMRLALDEGVSPPHFDQLIRELARSADPNISVGATNILRAVRGDAGTDYLQALELAEICDRVGMSNFSIDILYAWAAADPQAAMHYTGGLKDLASMRNVLRGLTTLPDETTLLHWMAGTPSKAQDIALAALYGRLSTSLFEQLQKITQSTVIVDQVEAAMEVMRMLPFSEAAAAAEWLKQLPEGENRQELARALARRLAAVDPQATLDLVQQERLKGKDYDLSMAHAVMEFAAKNDLAQSTRFIQQITDPKKYADALGQLAMVKFPGRPEEAFAYIQAHSRGDWEPAALRMLSSLYYNKLDNIDANAAEILNLDLERLGPEAVARASDFCKVWIDNRAPVTTPLAWTQQLPGNIGREARLQLARNPQLKPAIVEQFHVWIQTASISPAERAQLQMVLGKRLAVK